MSTEYYTRHCGLDRRGLFKIRGVSLLACVQLLSGAPGVRAAHSLTFSTEFGTSRYQITVPGWVLCTRASNAHSMQEKGKKTKKPCFPVEKVKFPETPVATVSHSLLQHSVGKRHLSCPFI